MMAETNTFVLETVISDLKRVMGIRAFIFGRMGVCLFLPEGVFLVLKEQNGQIDLDQHLVCM